MKTFESNGFRNGYWLSIDRFHWLFSNSNIYKNSIKISNKLSLAFHVLIWPRIKALISFFLRQDNAVPLYAKPTKLIGNGIKAAINEVRSDDGHPNEELSSATKHSMNSGDSANSSLQNINTLDSGISNCYSSTSTPTQDLRYGSSANKPNELNKQSDIKPGNESAASSSNNLDSNPDSNLDNLDDEANGLNKQIKQNNATNSQHAAKKESKNELRTEAATTGQSNEQKPGEQTKPLEYYEINAEFGANSRAGNRLLGEYHPVIMQKLKCYEISTELWFGLNFQENAIFIFAIFWCASHMVLRIKF